MKVSPIRHEAFDVDERRAPVLLMFLNLSVGERRGQSRPAVAPLATGHVACPLVFHFDPPNALPLEIDNVPTAADTGWDLHPLVEQR